MHKISAQRHGVMRMNTRGRLSTLQCLNDENASVSTTMGEYRHALMRKLHLCQLPSNKKCKTRSTVNSDRGDWQSNCRPDHETNGKRAQRKQDNCLEARGSTRPATRQRPTNCPPSPQAGSQEGAQTSDTGCRHQCRRLWLRCTRCHKW